MLRTLAPIPLALALALLVPFAAASVVPDQDVVVGLPAGTYSPCGLATGLADCSTPFVVPGTFTPPTPTVCSPATIICVPGMPSLSVTPPIPLIPVCSSDVTDLLFCDGVTVGDTRAELRTQNVGSSGSASIEVIVLGLPVVGATIPLP
jgi:hypothetical protein